MNGQQGDEHREAFNKSKRHSSSKALEVRQNRERIAHGGFPALPNMVGFGIVPPAYDGGYKRARWDRRLPQTEEKGRRAAPEHNMPL